MTTAKILSALFCTLLLAGCAGSMAQKNVDRMNSFVGQPEKAVIDAMGVPDKVYQLDSKVKIIAYTELSDRYDHPTGTVCLGSFPGSIGYSTCVGGSGTKRRTQLSCERSFHISGGKVIDWSQHGNNCPGGQQP